MMAAGDSPRNSTSAPARASTAPDVLRTRNKKRDDAIRKKVEQELNRKKTTRRGGQPGNTTPRRPKTGTVSSLRPAPAIIILETSRIVQAAQLMAAKRTDAVLVVNTEGSLSGILTDKDIAYRVVAPGLDVRTTLVSAVMTPNPISVYDKGNRNEALNIMVSRRFRHLPVISDGPGGGNGGDDDDQEETTSEFGASTSVVGLLDITKCVFERLDDLERKVNEDENIISAMEALERRGSVASEHVGRVRSQHGCPDVGTVLSTMEIEHMDHMVPEISIKATVRDAAKAMKENHQTAVLVSAGEMDERIGGICTTKDIVLRVLAASLDPNTTSVVRVMTPHPDSVATETSILDALKKLHAGHYLHLPVVDAGTPVGLVDVMTLTISMLTYLISKDGTAPDPNAAPGESGPMWNKFWNSTFSGTMESESDRHSQASDSITGSAVSYPPPPPPSERTSSYAMPRPGSMYDSMPGRGFDEMSHGGGSTVFSKAVDDVNFAFKLRDGATGKVYRFASRRDSYEELVERVRQKSGADETTDLKITYIDDEGDVISITTDKDLEEGVQMAVSAGWKRLLLFIGDIPTDNTVALLGRSTDHIDDSVSSVSAHSSPAMLRRRVTSSHPQSGTYDERAMSLNELGGVAAAHENEHPALKFMREAPMPVNVAISAGIVMAMGVIFIKMIK
ncbi:uncharacterized protein EV422DRAFT_536623 [Fimicolochytrium jonesii]|uniref:uncharacterized protein n=1 Tax=Fimicolochytrium jonesii TaxID=1396493 RepID=UPI0022FEFC04|nr:uncharacterized protein EV422DRAFT_536623 [Fimicolochytrium jonesii]KAI8818721.1 hypothetical protein EV422DRAFT_536623 [Fimicolochytrium jonesii]